MHLDNIRATWCRCIERLYAKKTKRFNAIIDQLGSILLLVSLVFLRNIYTNSNFPRHDLSRNCLIKLILSKLLDPDQPRLSALLILCETLRMQQNYTSQTQDKINNIYSFNSVSSFLLWFTAAAWYPVPFLKLVKHGKQTCEARKRSCVFIGTRQARDSLKNLATIGPCLRSVACSWSREDSWLCSKKLPCSDATRSLCWIHAITWLVGCELGWSWSGSFVSK